MDTADAGALRCARCERAFPLSDGIAYLLPAEVANAKTKDEERDGWQRLFTENEWRASADGILSVFSDSDDPYWTKVRGWFSWVDAVLDPIAGKSGVDLACGMGWATAHFTQAGANMIAADYNDTAGNGLRAATLVRDRGMQFDAICCDSESLPLADGSVDFVFVCSALHHFTRLDVALAEIHRVLRPGGLLIAVCEAFKIGIRDHHREEHYAPVRDNREAGINERSYRQGEYNRLFRRAGFQIHTYLQRWDRPLGGPPSRSWRHAGLDRHIAGHPRPLVRALLRLARLTPLPSILRWQRLHLSLRDRIMIGVKPDMASG